jgi:hypothetical protein
MESDLPKKFVKSRENIGTSSKMISKKNLHPTREELVSNRDLEHFETEIDHAITSFKTTLIVSLYGKETLSYSYHIKIVYRVDSTRQESSW